MPEKNSNILVNVSLTSWQGVHTEDDDDDDAYIQIQYYDIIFIYHFTFTGKHFQK
jgi:hypothetical protein